MLEIVFKEQSNCRKGSLDEAKSASHLVSKQELITKKDSFVYISLTEDDRDFIEKNFKNILHADRFSPLFLAGDVGLSILFHLV